ncbi:MAG: RimK family alpha-L-glutamate ligase [Clostridia bacterium]|nr:RimK family alpha-L-glutamate ligase [Clostridia bacterium]
MKEVLILYNGELDSGAFARQYESYKKSFEKLGVKARVLPTSEYISVLSGCNKMNNKPDAVIFLDKDIYSAKLLELKGLRLYNSSGCIRICDDKALTYLTLYEKGIPIPKTVIAPKIYGGCQQESWCIKAAEITGYPVVIKECFGSLGMQVYLAENKNELLSQIEKIGKKPFVLQEFLPEGAGWDLRVIIAGGEIIGAIKRKNEQDFRANAARGGTVEAVSLTKDQEKLALAAADATGAFFAGVDLIMGKNGFLVCEVNSNMLFNAAEEALAISVSDEIAEKIKSHSLNK